MAEDMGKGQSGIENAYYDSACETLRPPTLWVAVAKKTTSEKRVTIWLW